MLILWRAPFLMQVLSSCIQQLRHAPPRVRPGCASVQEARGGSPARVTVAPASGGRSSRAAAANDLAAPQPKAGSPAAKLLSGAELEAVRLAAACEVAGGGAPRGGAALSAGQLRCGCCRSRAGQQGVQRSAGLPECK